MANMLLSNLLEKERLCRNYQAQAEMYLKQNGYKPNEDQCKCLQLAADLEFEMSRITMGEDRAHHIREKNRLDYQIMKIRAELNPNGDDKSGDKAADGKDDGKGDKKVQKNEKTKDEEELDRTARTWYKDAPTHSFDDVSGMADLKKRLHGCITDAQAEKLMDYLKIPHLNSYFFVGPPGCGKTYIIEAFAHELMDKDYKFMSLQGSDIISRYVGDAEKIVTRLFEEAVNSAPCIIFIDEIDSVCKNRSLPNLPEYAANITTSFLTGYNRIHSVDSKIIFIGATNYPDRVDSAMLDRVEVVRVPLPDKEARAAALKKHFGDIAVLEDGLTFEEMAEATEHYNYRDIERVTTAIKRSLFKDVMDMFKDQDEAIEALKSGKYKLTRNKFNDAMAKFRPSPKEDIIRGLDEWERSLRSSDGGAEILGDDELEEQIMKEAEEILAPLDMPEEEPAPQLEEPEVVLPVSAAQESFMLDPVTGFATIIFKSNERSLSRPTACVNGFNFICAEVSGGYMFGYQPASGETEIEVTVADAQGIVGSFTAVIDRPDGI